MGEREEVSERAHRDKVSSSSSSKRERGGVGTGNAAGETRRPYINDSTIVDAISVAPLLEEGGRRGEMRRTGGGGGGRRLYVGN